MYRHLKIYLLVIFLFLQIFKISIYAEQLSKIEFFASSKFLSPNQDGFNDNIIFTVKLYQDLPIKVKEWSINILNYESKIIQIFQPQNRLKNQNEYTLNLEW
ncbi:MAG: hypothetical protein KatS3mg129_3197 [Leptospiraceae bacterium]|nr:MAG: hypothetical protein KatS3mg129_3197 [Leptospiraceae bacterium]